jgi:hypothetical protein
MIGQIVTLPICNGSFVTTTNGQFVLLGCSKSWVTQTGILIDPAYSPLIEALLNTGGINWAAVSVGFGSCLSLFASGAILGFFINLTRKAK